MLKSSTTFFFEIAKIVSFSVSCHLSTSTYNEPDPTLLSINEMHEHAQKSTIVEIYLREVVAIASCARSFFLLLC